MKYTIQDNQRAKAVDIVDFLAQRGINPVKQTGGELVYSSPLKDEKTPSFYVNQSKNVFNCFSTNNKGDIITLVQLLEKVNYSAAMEKLLSYKGGSASIVFNEPGVTYKKVEETEKPKAVIKKILPLNSQILRNYFVNERMIKESVAKRFLSEIHYSNKSGTFYAGCWRDDAGGYQLRSKKFKGCIGTKSTTTFLSDTDTNTVYVFEGYLDFLSWLSLFGTTPMELNDVVVLNSLSLLTNAFIGTLSNRYKNINLFLDNDESGEKAVQLVKNSLPNNNVFNLSKKAYPNHKDYNDFLCQKQNPNDNG